MFVESNTGTKRVHIYYTSISRQETGYMGSFCLSIFQKMETSRISSKIFKTFFREIAAVPCFKIATINRIFGWIIHFQTSSKFWTLRTIFSGNFDFIRILGRIGSAYSVIFSHQPKQERTAIRLIGRRLTARTAWETFTYPPRVY